jgi:hypothetical protein
MKNAVHAIPSVVSTKHICVGYSDAVSSGLHEATTVFRHEGVGNLAVLTERAGGADLIEAHEPRVACHVSGDYGRQPAYDPAWMCLSHGTQSRSRGHNVHELSAAPQ